jgi:hypothetical protein
VRLGDLSGAFLDQSLGWMKGREIRLTSRDPGNERLIKHGVSQALASLVEKLRRLRRHRSSPSSRISFISGERSR